MTQLVVALLGILGSTSMAWAAAEPICANGWIVFCDNFEDRDPGGAGGGLIATTSGNIGWDTSSPGQTWAVTTDAAGVYNGTKAVAGFYPAPNGGAGFADGLFVDATQTDVYVRWFQKYSSGWGYSYSTKGNYLVNTAQNAQNIMFHYLPGGTPASGLSPGATGTYMNVDAEFWYPWQPSYTLPTNQWVCLEFHDKRSSTATTADGIIQSWVDGVQKENRVNIINDNRPSGRDPRIGLYELVGTWNSDLGDTHIDQYKYVDNIVAGTQRIGCDVTANSGPSVDTGVAASAVAMGKKMLWFGGVAADLSACYFLWTQRHKAASAALTIWRYTVAQPWQQIWLWRYRCAVRRWQRDAPLCLPAPSGEILEVPSSVMQEQETTCPSRSAHI